MGDAYIVYIDLISC